MDASNEDVPMTAPVESSDVASTNETPAKTPAKSDPDSTPKSIEMEETPSSTKKPKAKRKSVGIANIKVSSISKKIPSYMAKSTKNSVTYFTLVHEAIVDMADRTGSSVPAIEKYIKTKHEEVLSVNPNAFHKAVLSAVKNGMKEGKLEKVRCSYKINKEWVQKEKKLHQAKEAKKKAAEKKKKKDVEAKKKESEKKKKEAEKAKVKIDSEKKKEKNSSDGGSAQKKDAIDKEFDKKMKAATTKEEWDKLLAEKKVQKEAQEKKREEAARIAKEREEKIKKRRFPMEDIALMKEDKELNVKKPSSVTRAPFLPYVLQSLGSHDNRPNSKKNTPGSVITAHTTNVDSGSRGLISDALQIYLFFVGDLGYARMEEGMDMVPDFSLKNLLYAVNEVQCGNAKKSKALPPLICQLFLAALLVLTSPKADDWVSPAEDDPDRPKWEALKKDLHKLKQSLSATSWAETLFCYMNAMQTFYTSDATKGGNAAPGFAIDMQYFDDDTEIKTTFSQDDDDNDLPSGYGGYIGAAGSALNRGYQKLMRHDPWNLSADELVAILRALTDDVVTSKPWMAEEMDKRDQKMYDLLKAKKSAESQFRKTRLAYEGPKQPKRTKSADGKTVEPVKFVPTATKEEFEAATKARDRAIDNYEKALKTQVQRTQPIGYDKYHNEVYFFHHDPDSLYVEMNKSKNDKFNETKSWHCIDSKALFDSFTSSLDVRGIRENDLFQVLDSGSASMKRYLHDSNKKEGLVAAFAKQMAELDKRLSIAMVASAESTRRSGRLANTSKDEVSLIQEEIVQAKIDHEEQLEALDNINNYAVLTGAVVAEDFEDSLKITDSCCELYHNDDSKPGIVGKIANDILLLEDVCNSLAHWENKVISREKWREEISSTADSWRDGCGLYLGSKDSSPSNDENETDTVSPSKRQRLSTESTNSLLPKGPSISMDHVISTLKGPLLDLENRIFSITGTERATKEVDEANDNVTVASDESDKGEADAERLEKTQYAWKKKIYSLHHILPRRAGPIRDTLIAAIAIARKGNLTDVLEDLRECLKLHRPGAGGRARTAALNLLTKYKFELKDDDDEDNDMDDDESMSEVGSVQDATDDTNDQEATFLSPEAMMLSGSLEGDDQADRVDWKDAVATCKTLSRFAALLTTLKHRATPSLDKLVKDKKTLSKAIAHWEASARTRKKSKKSKGSNKFGSGSEIWANVSPTDQFVFCRVDTFPWWPARVCIAKDDEIRESLKSLDRVLVSFIGEQHLYVVENDEVKPFSEDFVKQDLSSYSPEVAKNVEQGIKMAVRIMRGRGIKFGGEEDPSGMTVDIAEEKKTSC